MDAVPLGFTPLFPQCFFATLSTNENFIGIITKTRKSGGRKPWPGMGTIINAAAIILGGLLGLLCGKRLGAAAFL